jgi:hypothetical protein
LNAFAVGTDPAESADFAGTDFAGTDPAGMKIPGVFQIDF